MHNRPQMFKNPIGSEWSDGGLLVPGDIVGDTSGAYLLRATVSNPYTRTNKA